MKPNTPSPPLTQAAFTLVELLAVMAVIGVLLAFTSIGTGALRGRQVVRAADQVTLFFEGARQHALSSGKPTAAVILTHAGTEADGRAITLLEHTERSGWKQIREWSLLPEGSCIELGRNASRNTFSTVDDPTTGLPHATHSPVSFRGQTIPANGYAYRVFLPKGGVLTTNTAPILLRILEGRVENGISTPNGPSAFTLSLVSATGQTKTTLQ